MPRAGQIIPEHHFPHEMVVVNDNTGYTYEYPTPVDDTIHMLFVLVSPKGVDGAIQNFTNQGIFVRLMGQGPFSLYGQPYLNAYAALGSGYITAHVLRVTAPDATYSTSILVALYKIDETGNMTVKFKTRVPEQELTDLDDIDYLYDSPEGVISDGSEDDGYTEVKLLTVASRGKGKYGRQIQYAITSNTGGDKENDYKNYLFEVYENEGTPIRREIFAVCTDEDAVVDDDGLFIDTVVNKRSTGSSYVRVKANPEGFQQLLDAYNDANEDSTFTIADFDPLLGIDKYTRKSIENYTIDTMSDDAVVLNVSGGIALEGGDDGIFDETADPVARQNAINAQYLAAFAGEIDEMIFSRSRFPVHVMFDANYSIEVKQQMAALVERRGDCAAYFDCGLDIKTRKAPLTYVRYNLDAYLRNRNENVLAICGKIRDPYSKKIVTVTATYALARELPIHWANFGGKHVPFAGNKYGIIDDIFIEDSIYPVYDKDIHADIMDEMVDGRINFAVVNALQRIVIATQTTRQVGLSALSEMNNVHVLLDLARDLEELCATYQYNFAEAEDIVRFNNDAEQVVAPYRGQQVRSVYASFDHNDWEATRGILHLYVEMIHKDLVKTTIIEIDVNRGSVNSDNE